MPLMRCTKEGKPGWKYGQGGTCFTGKAGKSKAMKQGVAIEANKKAAPKKKAAPRKKAASSKD